MFLCVFHIWSIMSLRHYFPIMYCIFLLESLKFLIARNGLLIFTLSPSCLIKPSPPAFFFKTVNTTTLPPPPHLWNSQSRTQEGVSCSPHLLRATLNFQLDFNRRLLDRSERWGRLGYGVYWKPEHTAGEGASPSLRTPQHPPLLSLLQQFSSHSASRPLLPQPRDTIDSVFHSFQITLVLNPKGYGWPVSCFRNTFLVPLLWPQMIYVNPFQMSVSHLTAYLGDISQW